VVVALAASELTASRRAPDWAVLSLLCLGQLMVVLDLSIVNVALPQIRDSLGFSDVGLQWVVNAYAITFCGFLLFGGRAADVFGRRRLFVLGLVLFTVASLVGALAQNPGTLIAARVAQGLGGAILSPATLTLVNTTFTEPPRRAKAMAAWSAVAGGGAALGSALGGVLTDLINWRWILLVNLPVGIVAVVAAFLLLNESRAEDRKVRLDLPGSALVTLGLAAVVYGLVNTAGHGWGAAVSLVPLIGGVVLLVWFVVHEATVAKEPLMPLRFFRSRSVTVANLTMFWLGCAVIAHFYFLSLYMQNVLHYSPLAAGLAFLPGAALMTIGAYSGPAAMKRVGIRPLVIVGPIIAGLGLLWLTRVPQNGSYVADLLFPMMLVTFGTGLAMMPIAFAATSGIPREQAGLASGLINTTRQIGGAIGLAVLATIAASRTTSVLNGGADGATALIEGYQLAFLVGAIFAGLAVLTALATPKPEPMPQPVAQAPLEPATEEPATT
jgi:EmrB/QacA subfamily drug resistance transporter